jgi:cytidine deaminase
MDTALEPKQIDTLVEAAKEARQRAYAPYSRFQVGAALLGSDGQVYAGCNVENASFGLTICAERAAVANAIAHGCREFVALAVVAQSDSGLVTPCGACRQVLAEFNPNLPVICSNGTDPVRTLLLNDLLPYRFDFSVPP